MFILITPGTVRWQRTSMGEPAVAMRAWCGTVKLLGLPLGMMTAAVNLHQSTRKDQSTRVNFKWLVIHQIRIKFFFSLIILHWNISPLTTHAKHVYLLLPLAVLFISYPYTLSLYLNLFLVCFRSPYISFSLRVQVKGFLVYIIHQLP